VIDGTLALAGIEPLEMPARRLLNVAQKLWLDSYPLEARAELRLLLAWPEDQELARMREAKANRMAQEQEAAANLTASAAVVGARLDESAWEKAKAARAAGLAELERRKAEGAS
jgi:hypothetical protein